MSRATTTAVVVLAIVTGATSACQGGPVVTGAPATRLSTDAPTLIAPSPSPSTLAPIVIEDAGVEVDLAPGTYTSRVFKPAVQFDLPAGWQRRRATSESTINLDRSDGDLALSLVRVDYVQCGETLLSHPDAAAAAALIAKATTLAPVGPTSATVGTRQGQQVSLPGTGAGAGGEIDPANGCILTAGPEPFPADYAWVVLTSDLAAQLTFVDVDDALVMAIGRSLLQDLPAITDVSDAVVGSVEFLGAED